MKIDIQLTAEELHRICGDLGSELNNDMPGFADEDDFAGILKTWREHSPHYLFIDAQKFGHDIESAVGTREMHDETADLLERLLGLLPREEVSRV